MTGIGNMTSDGTLVIVAVDASGTVSGNLFTPDAADGADIGSAALEFSDIYLADGSIIYGQNDQSNTLTSSATDWTFGLDITVSGGNINTGDIALVIGDATTDTITFTTDGTGTAEIALPAGAIDGTEILDDTIDSDDYAATSIDNEHLADDAVDSDELAAGSVDDAHIADDTIQEPALNATNAPGDNQVLSYNLAGTNFTWVDAAGGGDMLKATYDSGDSGGVDVLTVVDSTYASAYVGIFDGATGQLAPKTDGALTYDATSGTLAATIFSGSGASLTNLDGEQLGNDTVDADSLDWGAFTDLGDGGAVTWGNVAAGELADDTVLFADLDDDGNYGPFTGAWDFTGGTLEIPNATDPDLTTVGAISMDTDGGNEPNDVTIRALEGDDQYMMASSLKTIQATIIKPNDMADTERDQCPIWHNSTGMVFNVVEIWAWSDTDDTDVNVEIVTAIDWSSPTTLDALSIATDGTSVYYVTETTISDATVAHDEIIVLDFDDTDDPGMVKVNIVGWFNADID
jgi:hypothetical protein